MAHQLVAVSDEGQYQVHPNALSVLDRYDTIKVVSIVGPHRSGKSFLLSQLFPALQTTANSAVTASSSRGMAAHTFQVGSSINACTKGIWYHLIEDTSRNPNPTTTTTTTSSRGCIIILDSEGINSQEATKLSANHDCNIFTLCLLLSSLLIYNSRGTIDQEALRNLKLVSKMSTLFYGDEGVAETKTTRRCHPPHLCWVLRDFALQLQAENGRVITADEYLETNIATHPELGAAFSSRTCFTLPRPCVNERDLQNLSHSSTQIRREFQVELGKLKTHVHQQCKAKTFMGQTVTGNMFITLLKQYTTTLNQKHLPKIQDSWTSMVAIKSRQLLAQIPQTFKTETIHLLRHESKWDLSNVERTIADQTRLYRDRFLKQSLDPSMEEAKIMDKLRVSGLAVLDTIQSLCDMWIDNKLREAVSHFQTESAHQDAPVNVRGKHDVANAGEHETHVVGGGGNEDEDDDDDDADDDTNNRMIGCQSSYGDAGGECKGGLKNVPERPNNDTSTLSVTSEGQNDSVDGADQHNADDDNDDIDGDDGDNVDDVKPADGDMALRHLTFSVDWPSLYEFWSNLRFPCKRLESLFLSAYQSYILRTVESAHRDLKLCQSHIGTLTQQSHSMQDARTKCELLSLQVQQSQQTIQNLHQQREETTQRYNLLLEKSEDFSRQLQLNLKGTQQQMHTSQSQIKLYEGRVQHLTLQNQSLTSDKSRLCNENSDLRKEKEREESKKGRKI